MLTRLREAMGGDKRVPKMQTIGMLNAGLTLQMIQCWGKSKGVLVLCRNEGSATGGTED